MEFNLECKMKTKIHKVLIYQMNTSGSYPKIFVDGIFQIFWMTGKNWWAIKQTFKYVRREFEVEDKHMNSKILVVDIEINGVENLAFKDGRVEMGQVFHIRYDMYASCATSYTKLGEGVLWRRRTEFWIHLYVMYGNIIILLWRNTYFWRLNWDDSFL